jgi:hypothetical protein
MWLSKHTSKVNKMWSLRQISGVNTRYYDGSEAQMKFAKSQLRKIRETMRMLEEERFFTFEQKEAKYDPKTGKIEIIDIKQKPDAKIIKNFDDVEKEKERLNTEFAEQASVDELADRYREMYENLDVGYVVDKSDFYAETHDHMRIDAGLIVMRPPIFLYYPKVDHDFTVLRNKTMNEYYLDMKKYQEDFHKETSVLESVLARNSYVSMSNRDNLPTHELKTEDGELKYYCGASKNWRKVDPTVNEPHSLHNAPQQRIYLLLKNKHTGEWEFPTMSLMNGESFTRVRKKLFAHISKEKWLVRHQHLSPALATLRPLTEFEKQDRRNSILSGVRTFYFQAFHLRGLPEFNFDTSDW